VIVIVLFVSVICLSYFMYVRKRKRLGNQKPETKAEEEMQLKETP
jgi:Mg2+/citrate symporter